jgi:UDP-N-acetylmuramoyl-L-alanyl-D-glutamate--2,6-diaminopimelate ligase
MIDIKTDSRKVKPGDTFIAIRNVARDGHDYIEAAIEAGASKIICEEGNFKVETEIVPDTRAYLNDYLYKNYYPKFSDMKFIGVTGTNGKTTICYLVYQMLCSLGLKCAYIGTIGFYYPEHMRELNNTTPDTDLLYEMFLEAKLAGCEVVVMEVSSHALDMNRIYGISYDEVAFTNLTQDHLDYHKTLDNYASAKEILFKKTRGNKIAIINADDPYHERFMKQENTNITISDKIGDVKILDIKFSNLGTNFSFEYENNTYETNIHMVGRYNVYNYLTAFLLVNKLGFNPNDILALNENLKAPKGRMELISYGTNSIFVDYAHTPDAVINVLESSKEYKQGRVITIVGCGGDRDPIKRPIMGHAAEEGSDYVIYTSDNPRTEDPKLILEDILKGVVKTNHEVIIDRKEAILKGMSMLKDKDILMILGKGHEDYQIIGKEKHHFSDQEIVYEYINEHSL